MKRISIIGAVVFGVTLVWACSSAVEVVLLTPDASAEDKNRESRSGSRLEIRPIVYHGDDGSVIRMGERIYDSELGVNCQLLPAADGVMRCLPYGGHITFNMLHYPSPDCDPEERVLAMHSQVCAYEYFFSFDYVDDCVSEENRRVRVFRLGAKADTVYADGYGTTECKESIQTEGGWEYRHLMEMSPDRFERLELR